MAKNDFRRAHQIEVGDEVSLNLGPDLYSDWKGTTRVVDCQTGDDGQVTLTLSVSPDVLVRIKPRQEQQVNQPTSQERALR